MLHPLEHVSDHHNPLADTTALASCQAPQLCRPRFAAKEVCRHRLSSQTWYACLITLPHLGITGSRYYQTSRGGSCMPVPRRHRPTEHLKERICIVDDDEWGADSLKILFETCGFDVRSH